MVEVETEREGGETHDRSSSQAELCTNTGTVVLYSITYKYPYLSAVQYDIWGKGGTSSGSSSRSIPSASASASAFV